MGSPSKPHATPPPPPMTTSTCTVEASQGTHLFHIAGYSLHERLGTGSSVRSAPFSVGGHDWAVRFFPNAGEGGALVLLLELLTKNVVARVSCHFRFLNQATGAASPKWHLSLMNYRAGFVNKQAKLSTFRRNLLMYAQDDGLTIECAVTVVKEPKVSETKAVSAFQEPPSDLSAHLGGLLLEDDDGSDVTFNVQGEVINAHKIILAMCSPVFKVEFYGPDATETVENLGSIAVSDVQPSVFKAMLHFIYTDMLPDMGDLGDDDKKEMIRHLLVAADQYELKRLKLMCEDSLCKSLSS